MTGRGIVVGGVQGSDALVQVYWIMGRSPNSQNRVFKKDDATGRLWTEAADPSKPVAPFLAEQHRSGRAACSQLL